MIHIIMLNDKNHFISISTGKSSDKIQHDFILVVLDNVYYYIFSIKIAGI